MDSRLTFNDSNGQTRTVPLTEGSLKLGGGPDDQIRMGAGFPASVLEFVHRTGGASWEVVRLNPSAYVTLDGESISDSLPTPLDSGAILTANGVSIVFTQKPDPPLVGGNAVRTIPLSKSGEHVIGRLSTGQPVAPGRIDLDPADSTVSGTHLRITPTKDSFTVEDVSRLGTLLNGDAFSQAVLVYGDRLRIGHYTFEFDGKNLRWLDQSNAGSITARNLTRRAGTKTILDQVSLQVRPGEFVGILGGSGQGKSTLLNALCGLVPASSGSVAISGQPLADKSALRKLGIGYVPQDDIVHKELRVRDALFLSGRLRINLPMPLIRARIERIIGQLGLTEHQDKRITQLSGGQRKRVSIGIELLSNPSVLFLDEPSSGLDPATEERLMVLLQSLALSGITVVCTTHVLHNAFLFNRLLFIHEGRLVFSGNSDEARRHFLGDENAPVQDQLEAPLEKIYVALADETISGQQREAEFRNSPYFQAVPPDDGTAPPPIPASAAARRVPAYKVLGVLLKRQWKILIADPLNIAFLLAQAVIISFLISWASDDIGMRAFIAVIAAMWFGCSNAAQQIISEILIVQRERVCGLGLNTYYFSKLAFLSMLTATQTAVLFVCITVLGNMFHPVEFNEKSFGERLTSRMTTVAGAEEPVSDPSFDFIAEGDDEYGDLETDDATAPGQPAAPVIVAPEPPSEETIARLARLASVFRIEDNLTQSGPRDLLLENGERARDAKGELLTFEGIPIRDVIFSTIGLRVLGLLLAGTIGVVLGLTVSSLVRSPTQSVMWVPLILIPQILFGGFVIPFPEMSASARTFCSAVPSFAAQRILEVSHIFGSATPYLANRTRTPVFLTSDGAKDTVEWKEDEREITQDYDKISPFNRAWQNLLVSPENRGKHKHESTKVAGTFTYLIRDSVKKRADVAYIKGTVVSTLAPAMKALLTLTVWSLVCYIFTIAGLLSKERAR